MIKVLCHVGPWCLEQFRVIAQNIDKDVDVKFISLFRELDETNISSLIKANGLELSNNSSVIESQETILRCRLLRSLSSTKAEVIEHATRSVIGQILDDYHPDVFISESVDQYFHDILFQECEKRDIKSIGLIRTFLNGYYRFSKRGEFCRTRQVQEVEVKKALGMLLDNDYIPSNLIKLKHSLTITYLKIMLSNVLRVVWFYTLTRLPRFELSYHHHVSWKNTLEEYLHFLPIRDIGKSNWNELLHKEKKTVFIPLQHFPEATIDYWTSDVSDIRYLETLVDFIRDHADRYNILIKEHPGVWGYRKPEFYKRLKKASKNIIFAPVSELSNNCLTKSDAVLTYTGTIGFEAILRGIPVLSFTESYYSSFSQRLFTLIKTDESYITIDNAISQRGITSSEQEYIISQLLSGFNKGFFRNDGSFDVTNPSHVSEAENIGRDIGIFLANKNF